MSSETCNVLVAFAITFTVMFVVHTIYEGTIQSEYIKALGACSVPLEGLKDK